MPALVPLLLLFLSPVPLHCQDSVSLNSLHSADAYAQTSAQGTLERRVNLVGVPFSVAAPYEPIMAHRNLKKFPNP